MEDVSESARGGRQYRSFATSISRRTLMKRGIALGMSLPAISAILAACGGDEESEEDEAEPTAQPTEEPVATEPAPDD
ncbi:MAG: hypothetical protein WD401_04795, partial [Thermomicrobiaceae bacterium]